MPVAEASPPLLGDSADRVEAAGGVEGEPDLVVGVHGGELVEGEDVAVGVAAGGGGALKVVTLHVDVDRAVGE